MAGTSGGSLPTFQGKGEEDAEQHWFLCEAIWRAAKGTTDANKLVEFQKTLWGRALQCYIKSVHCPRGGVAPTLDDVQQKLLCYKVLATQKRKTVKYCEAKRDQIGGRINNMGVCPVILGSDEQTNFLDPRHSTQGMVYWWYTSFHQDFFNAVEYGIPKVSAGTQAMRIESMAGYPGNTRVAATGVAPELSKVQTQIAALSEQIQELTKTKVGREQIWRTNCQTQGHHANECPLVRGWSCTGVFRSTILSIVYRRPDLLVNFPLTSVQGRKASNFPWRRPVSLLNFPQGPIKCFH